MDDLLSLVYKDNPQEKATNNFLINPAYEEVVMEERFEQYLKDINDNIRKNDKRSHLFVPSSSPQCLKCMQYTIKYKIQPVRKNAVLAEPQKTNEEKHSQKKPLTILKFHYMFVNVCGAVRILGERAAAKYPSGCYEFKGQMLSLKFEQHLMQRYVYLICQTNLVKHVYIWLFAMMNCFQFVCCWNTMLMLM